MIYNNINNININNNKINNNMINKIRFNSSISASGFKANNSKNIFSILSSNDEKNILPPLSDIIWGVGFKDTVNKSWADQVNA